jgi:hypothetical protein
MALHSPIKINNDQDEMPHERPGLDRTITAATLEEMYRGAVTAGEPEVVLR